MRSALTILFLLLAGIVSAQDQKEPDYTVIVTLGPDCPISQKYMHTLKEIHGTYGESITFNAIVPANFDSIEVSDFIETYNIPFATMLDNKNRLIQEFKLSVTPEVILIDKNNRILYQGAIDNWFYALGKSRAKVTETYLVDAISATIAGRKIETNKTEAIGCFIEPIK